MTIVRCLTCREEVTTPAVVGPEALVQCPLCKDTFRLGDVLNQLPPELIVLDPGHAADASNSTRATNEWEARTAAAIPKSEAAGEAAGRTGAVPGIPAFRLEERAAAPTRSANRSRTPIARRRSVGPLRHIAQVAGGGIAGVFLAQLILWWLPVDISVENRDVTGFGREYGRYVPFLVPASVRNARAEIADHVDSRSPRRPAKQAFDDQVSRTRDFPFAANRLLTEDRDTRGEKPTSPEKQSSPSSLEPPSAESNSGPPLSAKPVEPRPPQARAPSAETPPENSPGTSPSTLMPTPHPNPQPAAPAAPETASETSGRDPNVTVREEPLTVKGAPVVAAGEVGVRLAEAVRCQAALDSPDEQDAEQQRQLVAGFYQSLAGLGEAIVYADRSDADVSKSFRNTVQFLEALTRKPEPMELIGIVTPGWLDNPRPQTGVALYGTVSALETHGPYFATVLQLFSRDRRSMVVLSLKDPSREYGPASRLLVVGAVVKNPQQRLARYLGDAPLVVLDGLHVVVAEDPSP